MAEKDQETYLAEVKMDELIWRGLKKMMLELTSIKTLFLAFLCVAAWYNIITDMWLVIGGLATLGVKELPSNIIEVILTKVAGGGK